MSEKCMHTHIHMRTHARTHAHARTHTHTHTHLPVVLLTECLPLHIECAGVQGGWEGTLARGGPLTVASSDAQKNQLPLNNEQELKDNHSQKTIPKDYSALKAK